jgi:hypothetical protein
MLGDLEAARMRASNQVRALTTETVEGDNGGTFGKGLPSDSPTAQTLTDLVDQLSTLEHGATLLLKRQMRNHPVGGWVKATVGVGEKQAARLLAAIGDPYWHSAEDRPRTVSELWAYCGYHTVDGQAARRRKGQKANWSNNAKMRAYLIAESCIKQRHSPYRAVYDAARGKHEDAVHSVECVRCGPSGKPAPAGSPLSAGHQHARALRAVSKQVLKDLWKAARDAHLGSQNLCDTQTPRAAEVGAS